MGRTGDIDAHLLADEIRDLLCHQPIGHQFPSSDRNQIMQAISHPVIDEDKSSTDGSVILLFLPIGTGV